MDPPRELLQLGEHFTQALDRLHNFAAEFEAEFTAEMWLAQVAPGVSRHNQCSRNWPSLLSKVSVMSPAKR